MLLKKINIGIVAHVDAGKTTVTEQLLYHSGVIKEVGRVDSGNTQTDSMELERRRGISIKASTTSFNWKGMKINLIDTPGHVDFIAEVERSLSVLDGAILVVSAREGIQAQTRILFDTLQKLNIPTIIFLNKLDRIGSDYNKVVKDLKASLSNNIFPLQQVHKEGSKKVVIGSLYDEDSMSNIINILSELDEELLELYVNNELISKEHIEDKVSFYSKQGYLYPVLCGSAIQGLGIENLLDGIVKYLPEAKEYVKDELSAVVFKIEREKGNAKKAYVRLFQGEISLREIIKISNKNTEVKVKKINVIRDSKLIEEHSISAGDIGIIYGIDSLQIGDVLGSYCDDIKNVSITKPILKTRVCPVNKADKRNLFIALAMMAEEDPLLQLEIDDYENEIYINLFGYVQMEIIASVLEENYGLKIKFSDTTTIYKETPIGSGNSLIGIGEKMNPYAAGVGIKVDGLKRGEGFKFVSEVSVGSLSRAFQTAVEEAVVKTIKRGLLGWEVTDIRVTFTDSQYDSVNSTPSDFRDLTPMVLMEALDKAKTQLLEPLYEFEIKVPKEAGSKAVGDLQKMRATFNESAIIGNDFVVRGLIPVETSKYYSLQIAAYTEGTGRFFARFYGYEKAEGNLKVNLQKKGIDPLNKKQYLLYKMNAVRNG